MEASTNELDLAFCCDCTSSMGTYIETAKKNIRKISEEIHAMENRSVQYALVCYRDHPPQDSSYATKVFPFTSSIKKMQENVDSMSASGGGDGPESVACALNDVYNLDWRKNSVKVCVVISDAPPHGLGENGDGFPQGCPCGIDPLATARKMAEKKIVIYSVACEPALGAYKFARAFYKGIAELTSGRYLSLGNAHLLPTVIVGGSAEEMDLKKFENEVIQETINVKTTCPTLSATEVEDRVTLNLANKGVKTWQLDISHQTEAIPNAEYFISSPTLTEARTQIKPTAPSSNQFSMASLPPAAYGPPGSYGPSTAFGSSTAYGPPGSYGPSSASNPFSMASLPPGPPGSYPPSSAYTPPGSYPPSSAYTPPVSSYQSQSAHYHQSPISKEQVSKVMKKNM